MDVQQRTLWQLRSDLLRILAVLWTMAGLRSRLTIRRSLHRTVTRLLRPAEAAARRLIVVLARGIVVALPPPRIAVPGPRRVRRQADWMPFALAEPTPRYFRSQPGRGFSGIPAPIDKTISAARLARRLDALCNALDDLPTQAERLARWRALRRRARQRGVPCMLQPLRPGPPPDLRGRAGRRLRKHELFDLLRAAHQQAWWVMNEPGDTS
ncbi:MAG: hypothetical protein KF914_19830 [Rhizobiaceae bacterium]|nr:hypothetical protein [Rhizobiaceae bacterium]